MPLFPLMQGIAVSQLGIGIFQLRLLPVMIGALTLALIYAIAGRHFNRRAAVWSVILLLTWQWFMVSGRFNGTGIPFVDLTRIARYDMLAAMWGLAAFWQFVQAQESGSYRRSLLCGILVGLAALSHIYGLFWGAAILLILAVEWFLKPRLRTLLIGVLVGLGAAVTCLPWFAHVALHWEEFVGQQTIVAERFRLLHLDFYWNNLIGERIRYLPNLQVARNYLRAGLWFLLLIAPLGVFRLAYLGLYKAQRSPRRIAIAFAVIALLYALLLQPKVAVFLPLVLTVLAIIAGACVEWLLRTQQQWRRYATIGLLALVVGQGLWNILSLHRRVADWRHTGTYMAEIRAMIPPSAIVIGMSQFWLAVPEPGFRSLALPTFMADSMRNPNAIPFRTALETIDPDYLILDLEMAQRYEFDKETALLERNVHFREYLEQHEARLIGTVYDSAQNPIRIYRLDGSSQGRR
jgi:4-amino-4-deoxy-L-arabinose transferase-like glycosyltransferase